MANIQYFDSTKRDNKTFDINKASVIALRSIGKGYSAARKLFALLNLSPPIHQRHWSAHTERLEQESLVLLKETTDRPCEELLCARDKTNDIINVPTSFDGSWGSRGWASATGCMAAIAEKTGKILDVTMLCNQCNECELWKEKRQSSTIDSLDFLDWSVKHFPHCMMNHEGSAQVNKISSKFSFGY